MTLNHDIGPLKGIFGLRLGYKFISWLMILGRVSLSRHASKLNSNVMVFFPNTYFVVNVNMIRIYILLRGHGRESIPKVLGPTCCF